MVASRLTLPLPPPINHTLPRRVVKPRVNSLRPKGLGLGASVTEVQALTTSTGSSCLSRTHHSQKDEQPDGLKNGTTVMVISGHYRGRYGKVRNQAVPWSPRKIDLRVRGRRD